MFFDWLLTGVTSNSHSRPQPAGRGYVSISAGGMPGDRVERPVKGEQLDDLTATTRPKTGLATQMNRSKRRQVTNQIPVVAP